MTPSASHEPRELRLGIILAVVVGLLTFLSATGVRAENTKALAKVTDLNKKALEAYAVSDFAKARAMLKQALEVCTSSGLDNHPIAARTHIHMGVVMIGGLNQRDLALKQFRKALEIQPDIQVTRNVATPDVVEAFKEAQASAGAPEAGGGDTGAAGGPENGGDAGGEGGEAGEPARGISHTPVARAKSGAAILITAKVGVSGAKKVVVLYRAAGEEEYVPVAMSRAGGKYAATIPASATHGKSLTYFIQAQDTDESALASAGSEARPYTIALGGGAAPKCDEDDEKCEAGGGGEGGPVGRPLYFALMGGTGFGYTTGTGDLSSIHKVKSGFAPASILQIAPEVGYFINPDLRLSLQGRIQIISGGTPLNLDAYHMLDSTVDVNRCGSGHLCAVAPLAIAALARASWFFGSGSIRPYASAAVGGGQIRHLVKFGPPNVCGTKGMQACIDTVTAGPVLAGGGGGVVIGLNDMIGIVGELDSLLAFPKFTFNFDLNVGVSLRI